MAAIRLCPPWEPQYPLRCIFPSPLPSPRASHPAITGPEPSLLKSDPPGKETLPPPGPPFPTLAGKRSHPVASISFVSFQHRSEALLESASIRPVKWDRGGRSVCPAPVCPRFYANSRSTNRFPRRRRTPRRTRRPVFPRQPRMSDPCPPRSGQTGKKRFDQNTPVGHTSHQPLARPAGGPQCAPEPLSMRLRTHIPVPRAPARDLQEPPPAASQ